MTGLGGMFLAPAALAFLGLIPIVVLLYLLKLRRTEVVIPSTLLWIKSLHDLTANAPFQRLRKNLLLLLQVLALLALAIALGRPYVTAEGTKGKTYCCVIDRSASMQTVEQDGTRLDLAKEKALALVDAMASGDRMMVVSFAEKADVLCELTDDKYRLREAIRGIRAEDTRSKIRDVMLIVRSIAPDNRDLEVVAPDIELVLFSDGRLSDLDQLGAVSTNITYVQVGETDDNAGIVAFSVRRVDQGDAETAGDRQCFLLLHNEAEAARNVTVSLYFSPPRSQAPRSQVELGNEESALLAVSEAELPAQGNQEMVFALPSIEAGLLRAEVDIDDRLALDNVAWLALQPEAYLDVLLVSEPDAAGAYFLRRVLTLDPRASVSAIAPADYQDTNEFDLVIFNGWAPETLPAGTLLFVDAVPPVSGIGSGTPLENPVVAGMERDHPLMRFLNLGNVRIASAMGLALPEGGRALVTASQGPLIADVSRADQQIFLVAFDLGESNWPLHLSFPLFVQNLLTLAPGSGLEGESALQTGTALKLLPVPETTEAVITRPDGTLDTVALDAARPVYYGRTTLAGPYVAKRGEYETTYAVNLLDREESGIRPAASLDLGGAAIEATQGPVKFDKELWPWGVLAGLVLLLGEWWVYSRRADVG